MLRFFKSDKELDLSFYHEKIIEVFSVNDFSEIKSVNSKLSFLYGDRGFAAYYNKESLPMPPRHYQKKVISVIPISLVKHTEEAYDDLLWSSSFEDLSLTRLLPVCEYEMPIDDKLVSKRQGYLFYKKPEIVLFGQALQLKNYSFGRRPIINDLHLNQKGSNHIRRVNLEWNEIFLPDIIKDCSVDSMIRNRKNEFTNIHNIIYWAVTLGGGSSRDNEFSNIEFLFAKNGRNSNRARYVALSLTGGSGLPRMAQFKSNDFEMCFCFETFGMDMNTGIYGVDLRRRIKYSGSRQAFREFLENCNSQLVWRNWSAIQYSKI